MKRLNDIHLSEEVLTEEDISKVETLDGMMTALEDYHTKKDILPDVGSALIVKYMFSDKASDGTICNTKALVEEKKELLDTIDTPWVILGYNKTIPQYVKYRRKLPNSSYEYRYVSSVDDTTVMATVDGESKEIVIQHGFENAHLIDSNDRTGLLRQISYGCKTYTRNNENLPFGSTSIFTKTAESISAVSSEIAENIQTSDGNWHTYGNNNPYDCPRTITIGSNTYEFCGYTVTLQSKNLLTGNNGTSFQNRCRFDAPENQFAEAFNRFEEGIEYYIRQGLTFVKMTVSVGDPIIQEEVYSRNGNTFTCKSAYIQKKHKYSKEYTVGTLITDTTLQIQNNAEYDVGSSKWSQSDVRLYINSDVGYSEFAAGAATKRKNPFEKNTSSNPQTLGISMCNGTILKLSKDAEFMKYMCPSINRTTVFDAEFSRSSSNFKGSFVAYKSLESTSITTSGHVNRSHDEDTLFLLSYAELGGKNGTLFDNSESTSTFHDVFPQNTTTDPSGVGDMDVFRMKYSYGENGTLSTASTRWWVRSSQSLLPSNGSVALPTGRLVNDGAYNTYRLIAPACSLY